MNSTNQTITATTSPGYGSVHVRCRPDTQMLYLDYFVEGQRHRQRTGLVDSTVNRKKAESEARRLAAAKTLGSLAPLTRSKASCAIAKVMPTFSAFADIWLRDNAAQWRRSTRLVMAGLIKRYLEPAFGDLRIGQIDRSAVMTFRASLASDTGDRRSLSARTINEVMRVLGAILTEAAQREIVPHALDELPRLKTRKPLVQPFTPAELRSLCASMPSHYRPLVQLWSMTGLRTAELFGLRWKCVDLERATLSIRETWTAGQVDQTKTPRADREVHLPAAAVTLLRTIRRPDADADDPVFVTPRGARFDAHNFARRIWAPALKAAELDHRRPYELRHTYATLSLAAGESPQFIANQLGHASVETLFDTYARFIPNLLRKDGTQFEVLLQTTPFTGVAE